MTIQTSITEAKSEKQMAFAADCAKDAAQAFESKAAELASISDADLAAEGMTREQLDAIVSDVASRLSRPIPAQKWIFYRSRWQGIVNAVFDDALGLPSGHSTEIAQAFVLGLLDHRPR